MGDWELEDMWEWELEEDHQDFLYIATSELAILFFISDNDFTPVDRQSYDLGTLDVGSWWPLVNQLDKLVNLEAIIGLAHALDEILDLPGLLSGLLEEPLDFLENVLMGSLPRAPSGRRVDSRRLLKIARLVVLFLREFPPEARAASQAWADVHRQLMDDSSFDDLDFDEMNLADLLFAPDLPPALTGFSMMIGLTLIQWPERAEGLPLPPEFHAAPLYDEVFEQWESLPNSPSVTEEGAGEAEALFAQGQLAHMLAQMGAVELMTEDGEIDGEELALAYSRLSRAALWIHDQCRHCPERQGVACKVVASGLDQPVPLLDVAGEVANTSRIVGCVKM